MLLSVTRRYRAPSEEGVLCFPPAEEIAGQIAANRAILNTDAIQIDGTPLIDFRREAIKEILAAARQYHRDCGEPVPDYPDGPLFMSGHQPELTHVGVLVKTFALSGLAKKHGLTPLNIIVDNDTNKNTHLRFANLGESTPTKPDEVHLVTVPYDRYDGEITYERRPIADDELFQSFVDRSMPLTKNWGFEPLLPEMWSEMRRQSGRTRILGEVVAATRRTWERRWGCHNLELPLSRMTETKAFQRFARHIIADLPRFHALYNASVADYRKRNRVRSKNHPVPDLGKDGDSLEAPFWRILPDRDRRVRLQVKPAEMPDTHSLRSRALTTTLFMRYCLSENFIHGIGGAKYDEVLDALVERWLGLPSPGFVVFTATFRLPLPTFPTRPGDVRAAEHLVRDLQWNPQRYIPEFSRRLPVVAKLIEEKERLIAEQPAHTMLRKQWFRKLGSVTQKLRPYVAGQLEEAQKLLEHARIEAKANDALIRRDFAWCLFPEETIKQFCQRLL